MSADARDDLTDGTGGPSTSVSVVVVTYDSSDVVAGCLASIPGAMDGIDHRIVVVDNDSHDGTAELVESLPGAVEVVRAGGNLGYAAAINLGVAHLGAGDAVLVLNPDVRLAEGSVAPMVAALVDRVGIVVPGLVDEQGRRQRSLRREPSVARELAEAILGGRAARFEAGETIRDDAAYAAPVDVDWATGAVMLISARCLEDVGPMDESFFLYSEETEFMLRARDAGWRTRYEPTARAVHVGGELTRSPRLWSLRTLNRVKLHRRRHGRASATGFLGASLLREGLRAATGKPTGRQAARDLVRSGPGIALGRIRSSESGDPGWICFSAQDWWYFNRAHSDFQLMQPIARERPVLLVNSIGLRVPLPGRSTSPAKRLVRKAKSVGRFVRTPVPELPGYHVMSPLPLPLYGSERTRRLGTLLVRAQVWLVARSLGIIGPGRPDPVIAVTIPTAIGAARSLPHSALVVNRSDKYSSFAEADTASIRALEEECLAEADLVFYSANALRRSEAPLTGHRSRALDHGVDTELFRPSQEPIPADLQAIPRPRIGYFGAIRDHLVDLGLLEEVARRLPQASLVLVGPVVCPEERMSRLRALPNVHLLGARPHDEIPGYGRGFDVALMPWQQNEWIEHANPIKMKEYLALGLPIVSTDFPEVHRYADLVRIAKDHDDFICAVTDTLSDGGLATPAERRSAVEAATWDAAAALLLQTTEATINQVEDQRTGGTRVGRSTTLRGHGPGRDLVRGSRSGP